MKLSKREKVMVIGTIIIAVLFLFIYYYYLPLKDTIKDLEVQSVVLDEQIQEGEHKKVMIESLKRDISNLKIREDESQKFFMATIDEPEILYYMHGLISDKTMKQSLKYNDVEDMESYKQKDIDLDFHISYDELKEMLRQFEQGEYYTTLQEFTLEVDEELVGKYEIDENGRVSLVEEEKTPYNLKIDYKIRYYGIESSWDGSGQYEFMEKAKFYSD